jgi:energy-coupling factor transporter transmembrane protein EcfT
MAFVPVITGIICFLLDCMVFKMIWFGILFCGFAFITAMFFPDDGRIKWFFSMVVWWMTMMTLQVFLYFPVFYYAFGPPTKPHYGTYDTPWEYESPHKTEVDLECNKSTLGFGPTTRLFFGTEYRYTE